MRWLFTVSQVSLKFSELHQYVSECAPFGTPVDVSLANAMAHSQTKNAPAVTWAQKVSVAITYPLML